jgi:hypothetical protein
MNPSMSDAAYFLRPEGAFGERRLAAAFKNSSILKDFAKSASKFAHFESFACKMYASFAGRNAGFWFHIRRIHSLQHLTRFADSHLLTPVFLRHALTNRSVDEPAEVPGSQFPCRAILPRLYGAFPDEPTGAVILRAGLL